MRLLIIAGLVLAGLRAFFYAVRGPGYRGRERRFSGAGGRWHS
jgi:hypothetical protein